MTSILITDGEQRAALAAVRSLGLAGYTVHVCSSTSRSLAGRSRYRATETIVPDALEDPSGFVAALTHLAGSLGVDVLLPVSEGALLAVLPARESFDCLIPFVSADRFDRVCDKRQVLEIARTHGIAVPTQAEVFAYPDGYDPGQDIRFPAVVKPSRSVSGPELRRIRNTVSYAHDADELLEILTRLPASSYPVLLQQRIVGPGVGISLLIWDGELRAAFAHQRIREKPPSGGVSVLRESIPLDPGLLSQSLALLTDLEWQGVAMLEYKLDTLTGIHYLMEINGRLWGSLQLAIDAGVDFPLLLIKAALGIPSPRIMKYREGVRSRWEWGDVDNLLAMLFHSRSRLALPSGCPDRIAALGEFLKSWNSGTRTEVLRLNDPLPFIRETINWIRRR